MSAIISECGRYRYVLTRKTGSPMGWVMPCLFIMLNPSVADATKDDPTIRRCLGVARELGCTDLTVVNLFALRATDPKELLKSADPIGPANDQFIAEEIELARNGIIVAAWGAHPIARARAGEIMNTFAMPSHGGSPFKCLGVTKHGAPRHPLYVKSKTQLVPYG